MDPITAEVVRILFTVGAAWGAVKTSLNGARADITEIKGDVKDVIRTVSRHGERLAHLESSTSHKKPDSCP